MTKKKEEKGAAAPVAEVQQPQGIAGLPVIMDMARAHGVDPERYVKTVMKTAFKGDKEPTAEEFTAFMMVAKEYKLDPFMNQIYAFPSRGGIIPFLGIDGWVDLINRQERHAGLEVIEEETEDGEPAKTTCKIYIKGFEQPVTISERFAECYRDTDPWKSHPFRMLRHKSIIQCGRVAYGLSGLYDQDEAERILEARGEMVDVTPASASAGQVIPLPEDPDRVEEPETDAEIVDQDAETPQEEDSRIGKVEPPAEQEKPAEEPQEAPEGKTEANTQEDLTLEGEPTEEQKVRAKILELAGAMQMDDESYERRLKAAEAKGLKGLERLRQDMIKEYNATRNKG